MNRIQSILIATSLLAVSTVTQAQNKPANKFYLKVAGGYFFSVSPGQFPDVGPYPPRDIHDVINPTTGATTTIREKVLTGSYGEGARGGLSFGYNLNKYMSLEATFNYFHSTKNLMTRNVTTIQGTNTTVGGIESRGHVNAVDFSPSLVLSPGYAKWNPYVRFGMVVPLWGRLIINTDATKTSAVPGQPATIVAQTTIHRKEEIKPNATIGFQGALGVSYPISKRFDIYLEAEYRNVPVKSKSKEVTAYDETTNIVNTATGQPVAPSQHRGLNDLSIAERNTDYVTVLDQNSNTPIGTTGAKTNYKNDNAPANDLKSYINIGGLGANLGVKFRF
ncbi:outer membrane protein with beta-barrel domain [Chitinophaga skermanii]|uniref:Outer membrane protein with beta-barrel domain n=1 Tax=Chitinophaga skermanii TaxID=331697 RepID=A0A327QW76_9BACT|nr:outer membrane beta-barrel protein [Chitinophaga skermanii]RAJ08601.1 outer membrane protein with beta-barrel domain [Chitinophaga skermanii]